jgi:hypothetical protein
MIFDVENFYEFCSKLKIDTKEKGQQPLKLLGSQKYAIEQIADGLAHDIHTFLFLKGRQMGISTVMIALDLYWNFKYHGLQGTLVTDTDDNRTYFRSIIDMYMDSLPSTHKVLPVKGGNNRTHLVLRNRSRFTYQVAGVRKKGGLGRGKPINFMHGTECSSWVDEEGLASLIASFAETHPRRLYIFETTARGYNMFYDMWETAKDAEFQRAVFIGWWRNELYQCERDDPRYNYYWDGEFTSDEAVWAREVKELYDFEITDKHIAWWRWKLAEEIKDEMLMYQEFPPTEEYAFQLTGSKFFSAEQVNKDYKVSRDLVAQYYRYRMGMHFEHTQFMETTKQHAELTVWEHPDSDGVYVIGADPAYGSSEWADRFVASVWRCYADRIIQVAEFCTASINTVQFAWVLAHLCGNYSGALLNLEITGPGQAVFNELMNLQRLAGSKQATCADIYDVVAGIRHYLYKRQDTMGGSYAYQWQTNSREKERMFNNLRDYYERGMVEVSSAEALLEFRNIVRNDGAIGGDGRAKDDRVIGACLACVGWSDWLMIGLNAEQITYASEMARRAQEAGTHVLQRQVMRFMEAIRNPPEGPDDENWRD